MGEYLRVGAAGFRRTLATSPTVTAHNVAELLMKNKKKKHNKSKAKKDNNKDNKENKIKSNKEQPQTWSMSTLLKPYEGV